MHFKRPFRSYCVHHAACWSALLINFHLIFYYNVVHKTNTVKLPWNEGVYQCNYRNKTIFDTSLHCAAINKTQINSLFSLTSHFEDLCITKIITTFSQRETQLPNTITSFFVEKLSLWLSRCSSFLELPLATDYTLMYFFSAAMAMELASFDKIFRPR